MTRCNCPQCDPVTGDCPAAAEISALQAKLTRCREALEMIIRVNSNTDSENEEDGLPDIHDCAASALEETK